MATVKHYQNQSSMDERPDGEAITAQPQPFPAPDIASWLREVSSYDPFNHERRGPDGPDGPEETNTTGVNSSNRIQSYSQFTSIFRFASHGLPDYTGEVSFDMNRPSLRIIGFGANYDVFEADLGHAE